MNKPNRSRQHKDGGMSPEKLKKPRSSYEFFWWETEELEIKELSGFRSTSSK